MVRNRRELERLEKELIRREPVDIAKNFRLVSAMCREARALGVFPPKDPLEGIEINIKIARVVNAIPKTAK